MNPYFLYRHAIDKPTNIKLILDVPDIRIYKKYLSPGDIKDLSVKFTRHISNETKGVYIDNEFVNIDFKDVNYGAELDAKLDLLFDLKEDNVHYVSRICCLKDDDYWIKNSNNDITILFKNRSFKNYFKNFAKTNIYKNVQDDSNYMSEFYKAKKYINENTKSGYFDPRNHFRNLSPKLNTLFEKWNTLHFVNSMSFVFYYLTTTWHYSDTIIKSPFIMTIMKPILEKNYELTGYVLTYYFYTMYKIECYWDQHMRLTDRCVFTLDEAHLLPQLPVEYYYPETSPFFPLSVNRNMVNGKRNLLGYGKTSLFQIGFSSKDECYRNFCLFTSANQNRDIKDGKYTTIFDGLNLNDYAVFCGSLMTFMIPKDDPQTYQYPELKKYHLMQNEYKESDIDIMVTSQDADEYCNDHLIPIVSANLAKYNPEFKSVDVTKVYNVTYCITQKFLDTYFEPRFHEYIKQKSIYAKRWVHNIIKDMPMTLKYPDLYKNLQRLPNIKYCTATAFIFKAYENCKIHINSPFMTRNIEIFGITKNTHIGNVSKFHMPCVRAYYDMKTAYMTPSFICSVLTRCNIDLKYVFSVKNPLDIILKQYGRGFGTICNATEKRYLKIRANNNIFGYQEYDTKIDKAQYIEQNDLFWKNVDKLKMSMIFPVNVYGKLLPLEPGLLGLNIKKLKF